MTLLLRWLAALAFLGASSALGATNAAAADQYLAIAFSKSNGTYGFWHRATSRQRAEEGALQQCGPGCAVVIWSRNACAALAVGTGNGFGTYWSTDKNVVVSGAVAECNKRTSGCKLKVMTCSNY